MSDLPLENGNEIPVWKSALSINETVCREVSSEASQCLLGGWVPLAARNSAPLCWKVPLLVVVFRCRCSFGPELRQTGLSKGMLKSGGILVVQRFGKRNSPHPVVGGWWCLTGFFIYSATIRSHHPNLSTAFRAVLPSAP